MQWSRPYITQITSQKPWLIVLYKGLYYLKQGFYKSLETQESSSLELQGLPPKFFIQPQVGILLQTYWVLNESQMVKPRGNWLAQHRQLNSLRWRANPNPGPTIRAPPGGDFCWEIFCWDISEVAEKFGIPPHFSGQLSIFPDVCCCFPGFLVFLIHWQG